MQIKSMNMFVFTYGVSTGVLFNVQRVTLTSDIWDACGSAGCSRMFMRMQITDFATVHNDLLSVHYTFGGANSITHPRPAVVWVDDETAPRMLACSTLSRFVYSDLSTGVPELDALFSAISTGVGHDSLHDVLRAGHTHVYASVPIIGSELLSLFEVSALTDSLEDYTKCAQTVFTTETSQLKSWSGNWTAMREAVPRLRSLRRPGMLLAETLCTR